MSQPDEPAPPPSPPQTSQAEGTPSPSGPPSGTQQVREIGGRGGLDPTRFGDWEKGGRCIDF